MLRRGRRGVASRFRKRSASGCETAKRPPAAPAEHAFSVVRRAASAAALFRMRRQVGRIVSVAAAFVAGVVVTLATSTFRGREQVTLVSLSPDEQQRVWLVELPVWMDRNFELRVEDLRTGSTRTLFRSPDEGRPVGSERI